MRIGSWILLIDFVPTHSIDKNHKIKHDNVGEQYNKVAYTEKYWHVVVIIQYKLQL